MTMTDPIADMLTRVRNAASTGKASVDVLASGTNQEIAKVLLAEGFIHAWKPMDEGLHGMLRIYLKYGDRGEAIIRGIDRVSRPGRRVYRRADDIQPVYQGTGIMIVTTPKGVLSDRQCRQEKVGGEVLCQVW